MYDDVEYAARRLNGTAVRLESGEPYFVRETFMDEDFEIAHSGLNLQANRVCVVKHKMLNLEPIPLGFINTSSDMIFVTRVPKRRDWKQGLAASNMHIYGKIDPSDFNFRLLVQPVSSQYPSFTKALDLLGPNKNSVAFCRDFGLSQGKGNVKLVYRQYHVGEIIHRTPCLFPDKAFLEQHLQEVVR